MPPASTRWYAARADRGARPASLEAADLAVAVAESAAAGVRIGFVEQADRSGFAIEQCIGRARWHAGFARSLLLLPARADRIGRFGRLERGQQFLLLVFGQVGPVAVGERAGHRVEQVQAGPEAGALDLEEGLDRADALEVL